MSTIPVPCRWSRPGGARHGRCRGHRRRLLRSQLRRHRRQDRQRPRPPLREVRDPVGHRQRAGRPRRRRGARRRSPTASRSVATWPTPSRSAGSGPRLLHLRHGARRAACCRPSSAASCSRPSTAGMHIVNGLHEFLNDDPEFAAAAAAHGVEILDVRRPRDKKDLRMFSGRIADGHLPAHRRARHRRRHRQAHHGHDPDPGAQRPRHQGGHGRHRPDRPHPGRPLRRRPRRHPVASSARARWRPPSSRRSRASTPT